MQVVKNSKISFDGQLLEVVMEMSFFYFSQILEKNCLGAIILRRNEEQLLRKERNKEVVNTD